MSNKDIRLEYNENSNKISDSDIEHAKNISSTYIEKLKNKFESNQAITEISQKENNILFVHTMYLNGLSFLGCSLFVIYKEQFYMIGTDDTNSAVDLVDLENDQIKLSAELFMQKDKYTIFTKEMLDRILKEN